MSRTTNISDLTHLAAGPSSRYEGHMTVAYEDPTVRHLNAPVIASYFSGNASMTNGVRKQKRFANLSTLAAALPANTGSVDMLQDIAKTGKGIYFDEGGMSEVRDSWAAEMSGVTKKEFGYPARVTPMLMYSRSTKDSGFDQQRARIYPNTGSFAKSVSKAADTSQGLPTNIQFDGGDTVLVYPVPKTETKAVPIDRRDGRLIYDKDLVHVLGPSSKIHCTSKVDRPEWIDPTQAESLPIGQSRQRPSAGPSETSEVRRNAGGFKPRSITVLPLNQVLDGTSALAVHEYPSAETFTGDYGLDHTKRPETRTSTTMEAGKPVLWSYLCDVPPGVINQSGEGEFWCDQDTLDRVASSLPSVHYRKPWNRPKWHKDVQASDTWVASAVSTEPRPGATETTTGSGSLQPGYQASTRNDQDMTPGALSPTIFHEWAPWEVLGFGGTS